MVPPLLERIYCYETPRDYEGSEDRNTVLAPIKQCYNHFLPYPLQFIYHPTIWLYLNTEIVIKSQKQEVPSERIEWRYLLLISSVINGSFLILYPVHEPWFPSLSTRIELQWKGEEGKTLKQRRKICSNATFLTSILTRIHRGLNSVLSGEKAVLDCLSYGTARTPKLN
jgi:hypothetical protein